PLDEAVLLPLTEVPVSAEMLAAIHARLSGRRIAHAGSDQDFTEAVASTGVTTFPGWEFYAPVFNPASPIGPASAETGGTLFDLLTNSLVLLDEPSDMRRVAENWWEKVAATHERSG